MQVAALACGLFCTEQYIWFMAVITNYIGLVDP